MQILAGLGSVSKGCLRPPAIGQGPRERGSQGLHAYQAQPSGLGFTVRLLEQGNLREEVEYKSGSEAKAQSWKGPVHRVVKKNLIP